MIDLSLFLIGLAALIAGSINDLRIREVPDWLSYSLIVSAISARLIISLVSSDYSVIIEGLIGFVIMVGLGYLMYYTAQWGGGDSKILMGLGAVFGFKMSFTEGILPLIINILIIGAAYGIVFNVYVALKNKNKFKKEFLRLVSNKKLKMFRAVFLSFVLIAAAFSLFYFRGHDEVLLLVMLSISIFLFYSIIAAKAIERSCMVRYVDISKLREGDWIAEEIYDKKNLICGPKDLGISKKQIKTIKKMFQSGKIKKVKIREGIPFVPGILLAYIFTYLFGNIIFFIL